MQALIQPAITLAAHLTFSCSKSTVEKLEKGVKYHVSDAVLVSLLLTLYIFHTFSRVSVTDFVQINISWDLLSPSIFTGILSYFLSISVSKYFLVPNFG